MFKMRKKKFGLSFIELVVALFLVNIAFFSFVAFISMTIKSSKQGQDVSKGTIVANSLLEDYIAEHRSHLMPMTGTKTFGNTDYAYAITTERVSDLAPDGKALYKISISVNYIDIQNGAEGQRKVSFSTIVHGEE